MFLIDDRINGKEIALSRKVGMKFGFEYYLIHVSSPEYECWELICIMESHINLTSGILTFLALERCLNTKAGV